MGPETGLRLDLEVLDLSFFGDNRILQLGYELMVMGAWQMGWGLGSEVVTNGQLGQ